MASAIHIDLFGVPLDLGSERIGVDMGPNALRYQQFVYNLSLAGLDITDRGNVYCPSPEEADIGDPKIKYLSSVTSVCSDLSEKVSQSIKRKKNVIVLGGDHAIAIGSVTGAARAVQGTIGVIWIDAHGDINTDATSLTGNIHGMPAAALLGYGHTALVPRHKGKAIIETPNILFIGLKDTDPAEDEFISSHKVPSFFVKDIVARGLGPVLEAITDLSQRVRHIWVSMDLDAVDAEEAPGVGMPNKGGLTYREISTIAQHIGTSATILGLDVVEYNPVNDIQRKTATLAAELTAKMFGKTYSRYSEYMRHHAIKK